MFIRPVRKTLVFNTVCTSCSTQTVYYICVLCVKYGMHAYAGPACICRMHAPSMLIPPTQPMHAGRTYALCTPLICCICEHSRCHISAKFKATQLVGISPRLFIPPKGIFAEMSSKLPELWRRYRRGKWPHFLSLSSLHGESDSRHRTERDYAR